MKVHVWAGISLRVREYRNMCIQRHEGSPLCSNTGRDASSVSSDVFPSVHRFMQDNDPKHISRRARAFFEDNSVRPPQSLQIPIPSKISGMSLRSTSGGKSSLTLKMN